MPSVNRAAAGTLVFSAEVACDATDAIDTLKRGLGDAPLALVVLFASPEADLDVLARDARAAWGRTQVIGCTTAGEINPDRGYTEGSILALGFPAAHFRAETVVLPDLGRLDDQDTIGETIRARARLGRSGAAFENEFAFLLVDGLSMAEDRLAATLASGLGPMPMFGGSSGDGTRFDRTVVFANGDILASGAVLTMLRTDCGVRVFSLDHFQPTDRRMVVTRADPTRRVVHEINAEPAARELARVLGKSPDQIDTFTFAESPMVVRLGNKHHVRAIKRVTEDGDLEFFSAIDEGLVLTIADSAPMVSHLETELTALARPAKPAAIIAFDCLLRRIEAEQKQITRDMSAVLARHRVAGFCTYGEQMGSLHVNQTMTGVALYAPDASDTDA
jgi:hypothetical protein